MTSSGSFFAVLLADQPDVCFEIIAATFLPNSKFMAGATQPTGRDVIPAHNESAGVQSAWEDAKSQLGERDRLVVVVDNRTDAADRIRSLETI